MALKYGKKWYKNKKQASEILGVSMDALTDRIRESVDIEIINLAEVEEMGLIPGFGDGVEQAKTKTQKEPAIEFKGEPEPEPEPVVEEPEPAPRPRPRPRPQRNHNVAINQRLPLKERLEKALRDREQNGG